MEYDKELAHYGVKGMKWGVRKDRKPTSVTVSQTPGKRVKTKGGDNLPASKDALSTAKLKQKAKRSSVDALSNDELKTLVNRMNLEQQYSNLSSREVTGGKKFVQEYLTSRGKNVAMNMVDDQVKMGVKKAFEDQLKKK